MAADMEISEQDWKQAGALAEALDDKGPAQAYRALAALFRDQRIKLDKERARTLDEVDAAIRCLGSWEYGGLHYVQNSAVYVAINDIRKAP